LAEGSVALAEEMTGNDPRRYLDPALLAQVGLSPLLAKVVVEGFLNGLHQSPFHGFSVEFAEHREYVPGDDPRYVDWALYARTDHYYIKRYEEETNLRGYLLLDGSGSMRFGTGQITKWDYACFLANCLAYLMVRQQDAAGLALLSERPGLFLAPRSQRSHLRQLAAACVRHRPAGTVSLPASLHAVTRKLKRRGMVVLLSDLLDEPQETLRAIKLLAAHRHDVLVFHVLDAAERDFHFPQPALFRDLETGEEMEIDPALARAAYSQEMTALQRFYREGLAALGVDYQLIDTRQSFDRALGAYLRRRARSRR
jgi:uncharacterized protein (DUF58 family)